MDNQATKNHKTSIWSKLMNHWSLESYTQVIVILFVFSITGSMAVFLATPITHLIGIDSADTSPWVFWPIRILIIFPIYQIMLIIIGSLCGQFKFFWAFEKKMLSRFVRKSL